MGASSPYAEIIGAATIYIAPYGTAEPAIDTTPSGAWTELGCTTGDQDIQHSGALTFFRDNCHTGPTTARREEEDVLIHFTVKDLTLEHYARILHNVSKITTGVSGGATVKSMPFKRGQVPTEYALLVKGATDSPYGLYPGQVYIPRCVQASEPQPTRGKATRAELECEFVALEDDAQSDSDDRLGWSTVQTS